jgi:ABC-type transport system substrate-binding protein
MESYEPGVQIRIVRDDNYRGDRPAIQEIVFPIYTDQNQTVLKLKAKELSAGYLRASQYRQQVQQYEGKPKDSLPKDNPFLNENITCDNLDSPLYRYVGWNADRPMFKDKMVRRAMTHALNREAIVKDVFVGLGSVAVGPFLPSTPFNDPGVRAWSFDLDEAKKVLSAAGWQDTDGDGLLDKDLGTGKKVPFEFSLLIVAGIQDYQTLASVYKEDLLKIGVKLNIETAEWSLMLKRVEDKNFDAILMGWGLSWVTDPYQIWHSSQADIPKGSNHVGFRNKEADGIIEELRRTFDMDKRTELLRHFHRIVHEEQPYTFVIVPQKPFCYWKSVRGVVYAKTRPLDDSRPWWLEP